MQNDFQSEYVARSVARVKDILFEEFIDFNKKRLNKIQEESPELKGDLLTYERISAHDNGWETYLPKLLNKEPIEERLRDEISRDYNPKKKNVGMVIYEDMKLTKVMEQSKETFRIVGTREVIVFEEWPESYDFVYKQSYIVLVRDKRNPDKQILVLRNTQRNIKRAKNRWGVNKFWKVKIYKTGHVRLYLKQQCRWLSLKNWPNLCLISSNKEVQRILMTMNPQHEYIRNMPDKFPIENYKIANKDYRKLSSPAAFYEHYSSKFLLKYPTNAVVAKLIFDQFENKDLMIRFLSNLKSEAWTVDMNHYADIYHMYLNNLENKPENLRIYDILDTRRIAGSLGEPFNWFIKSGKKFKEYHDDLARRVRIKEIEEENKPLTPDMKFDVLKSDENYTVEFITTKLRLFEESDIQKHCVSSYWRKINDGQCGIYSIVDKEGLRWTVELSLFVKVGHKGEVIMVNQCRGKFNSQAPKELIEWIEKQLDAKNTSIQR